MDRFKILLPLIIFLISSCKQIDLHESHTLIPKNEWNASFPGQGSFIIKDTAALYKISLVLRHLDAYNYNNIWLSMGLQAPGDTIKMQTLEIPLGNDANGWFGSGMDNIWEIRHQLTNGPQHFRKPGTYQYKIYQIMRDRPLSGILSVGVRVEKL